MMYKNVNLKKFNTFKVDAKCKTMFCFDKVEQLQNFMNEKIVETSKIFILGGGSNVLFTQDFDGIILHPTNKEIKLISNENNRVRIEASAGCDWSQLIEFCISKGLKGLENLTLIPGKVGASPVQNIGAYGSEVSSCIESVICFDLEKKEIKTINNKECKFTYRSSIFKQNKHLLILKVNFILSTSVFYSFKSKTYLGLFGEIIKQLLSLIFIINKAYRIESTSNWKLKINHEKLRILLALGIVPVKVKSKIVKFIRKKTMPDPEKIGNAGCFFKSPIVDLENLEKILHIDPAIGYHTYGDGYYKLLAGDLIKSCNWIDKRIGDATTFTRRPVIIINLNSANGAEILKFSKLIQIDIKNKFDVLIEPEVELV